MKQWVLVLTNSNDATADFLVGKLEGSGVPFVRLNTDAFAEKALLSATESQSHISFAGKQYTVESFSHVWLRRPQPFNIGTRSDPAETSHMEQEWSAALEGWLARIPGERWINHPANNASASYKLEQLWRAKQMGLLVPPTLITQSRDEARKFYEDNDGAIVVKPLRGGYIERNGSEPDTVIYTRALGQEDISLFPAANACPTLLQQRVPKKCDVRITIVDDDLHSVALTALDDGGGQRLDIRRNKMADVAYEPIKLPEELEIKIRSYVRSYRLRFAAIDMALDQANRWIFFELNPNGEWAWLDQAGGANIAGSFIRAFRR